MSFFKNVDKFTKFLVNMTKFHEMQEMKVDSSDRNVHIEKISSLGDGISKIILEFEEPFLKNIQEFNFGIHNCYWHDNTHFFLKKKI